MIPMISHNILSGRINWVVAGIDNVNAWSQNTHDNIDILSQAMKSPSNIAFSMLVIVSNFSLKSSNKSSSKSSRIWKNYQTFHNDFFKVLIPVKSTTSIENSWLMYSTSESTATLFYGTI